MYTRYACVRRFVTSYIIYRFVDVLGRSRHRRRDVCGSTRGKMISGNGVDCFESIFHTVFAPAAVRMHVYEACRTEFAVEVCSFALDLFAYGCDYTVLGSNVGSGYSSLRINPCVNKCDCHKISFCV